MFQKSFFFIFYIPVLQFIIVLSIVLWYSNVNYTTVKNLKTKLPIVIRQWVIRDLDICQALQFLSQIRLLPGTVSNAEVTLQGSVAINGTAQLKLLDNACGRQITGFTQ